MKLQPVTVTQLPLQKNTTNNSYEYYVWGNNDNYQTGITTNTLPISAPVKNTDMSQTIDITSGNASMLVQKGTGTVNVIGDNTNGKLAVGNNNSVNEIVAAKSEDSTDFTGVLAAAVSNVTAVCQHSLCRTVQSEQ